jgi:exonuclease SbcD
VRVLFVSDTHLGLDLPSRPRIERRRRGPDFFANFERALAPAFRGEADAVVHGGDLHFRSRVPGWLAAAALAPLKRVAAAGVPVLLVLGNHERARLPWPLLACEERLHVFDRPRSVVIEARGERVAFHGFPYVREARRRFRDVLAAATREGHDADARVLCMHQCVEGATCGPGTFTFRWGDDVVRAADLPADVAVTLCGHVHRHQVLRPAGRPPVVYAGSVERTSFAEADETKGYVMLDVGRAGLAGVEFRPLPARPMIVRAVPCSGMRRAEVIALVARAIEESPADAVLQLRLAGSIPGGLDAASLRAMSGARNVTLVEGRGSAN